MFLWTGWVLSSLVSAFMLMGFVMAMMSPPEMVKSFTNDFGYPKSAIIPLGIVEGIMAVLYAHVRLGLPLREALKELSLRHLHVRQGKTGVLDYTFERYFAEGEPAGLSFLDWVRSPAYDPKRIKADFHAAWWGALLTERLLKRE